MRVFCCAFGHKLQMTLASPMNLRMIHLCFFYSLNFTKLRTTYDVYAHTMGGRVSNRPDKLPAQILTYQFPNLILNIELIAIF